jgi:glycosyltransferase involved in cell wall biosynthesis
VLVEAAARLRPRFPDLHVLLAGREPAYANGFANDLLALARFYGIGDRLEFAGWVDSIEHVLSRSTVYVQPSYTSARRGGEGLGLAIAEAGWAGLPVVASRTGGTAEAMQDGVSGTLVDPRDPEALAVAIARYLAQPHTAQAAGEAGSRFARHRFDPGNASGLWVGALEAFAASSFRERARRQLAPD